MRLHRILTLSGRLNLDVTGISGYTINSEIKIRYKGGAVYAEDKKLIDNIKGLDSGMLVYDQKDRPVILVNNEWSLNWILERNPGIQFLTVPSDVAKI